MKKIIIITSLLISTTTFAKALTLTCEASYNLNKVFSTEITLNEGERDLRIGEHEEYEFFITSKGQGVVELQALNVIEPSRSYSEMKLTKDSPSIKMTIWKRESILDLACTL